MSGAEWKTFYADDNSWPDGSWHDDAEITIDGSAVGPDFDLSKVSDCAQMSVSGGVVFFEETDEGPSLESHFKKWRKQQNTIFITVECNKDAVEKVRAAIASAGGKAL
jgi:hypothetical protein